MKEKMSEPNEQRPHRDDILDGELRSKNDVLEDPKYNPKEHKTDEKKEELPEPPTNVKIIGSTAEYAKQFLDTIMKRKDDELPVKIILTLKEAGNSEDEMMKVVASMKDEEGEKAMVTLDEVDSATEEYFNMQNIRILKSMEELEAFIKS